MLAEPPVAPARLAAIRAPFAAYGEAQGGVWTRAPVLQPLALLLDLAGEAMRARLLEVRGGSGEALCLRPDFTIAIAAAHLASRTGEGRYLYEGEAFRAAEPATGRPVEFLQIGVEAYGAVDDPVAQDVEIAALAWAAAMAGGRIDLGLVLGDVALFAAFLRVLEIPASVVSVLVHAFASGRGLRRELSGAESSHRPAGGRLARLLGELPEAEAAAVLEEVWRLAGVSPVGGRAPAEIVHRLAHRGLPESGRRLKPTQAALVERYLQILGPPRQAMAELKALAREAGGDLSRELAAWDRRLSLLERAGAPGTLMVFSTGFVRPFSYYDGMFFEVRSLDLGFDQPVAAGGRYDGLPARLGGAARGAVGCMVRPGRAVAEAQS